MPVGILRAEAQRLQDSLQELREQMDYFVGEELFSSETAGAVSKAYNPSQFVGGTLSSQLDQFRRAATSSTALFQPVHSTATDSHASSAKHTHVIADSRAADQRQSTDQSKVHLVGTETPPQAQRRTIDLTHPIANDKRRSTPQCKQQTRTTRSTTTSRAVAVSRRPTIHAVTEAESDEEFELPRPIGAVPRESTITTPEPKLFKRKFARLYQPSGQVDGL